jgi:hypothetical protein
MVIAVLFIAALTGIVWGPLVHARWYVFVAAASLAFAVGLLISLGARVAGLRPGGSATAAVLYVVVLNFAVFAWAISHSR